MNAVGDVLPWRSRKLLVCDKIKSNSCVGCDVVAISKALDGTEHPVARAKCLHSETYHGKAFKICVLSLLFTVIITHTHIHFCVIDLRLHMVCLCMCAQEKWGGNWLLLTTDTFAFLLPIFLFAQM